MSKAEDILTYIKSRISNEKVIEAFRKVNRKEFLPEKLRIIAYSLEHIDEPIQITKKYTTTALTLGLKMIELLDLNQGEKVLEIGTGIGYYTALIAEIVGDNNVYSIEFDEEMFNISRKNLEKYKVKLIFGDGSLGYDEGKPYDKAIIWAASPTFPYSIFLQMKDNGVIVVPITDKKDKQGLYKIVKKGNSPIITRYFDVIFSPLRGLCGYWN